MRGSLKRVFAATALLVLSSSWVVGWSLEVHLAADDHHGVGSPDDGGRSGLEMALHGHAHAEGTPAHGHPVLGSVAAPIPRKPLVLIAAMIGDAPEVTLAGCSGRRLFLQAGPTHDPPPRPQAVSILRI